ncbi:MAG: MgtC/SapB family protein, partial [Clostridiales bacterium]|nr:MgtC/SapB family protein [Clostridiales bacterium]
MLRQYLLLQLEFLLKLLAAGICGAVIGYERKNHLKEAGIRTHMLVAMGATLIMIVSKYGFLGYDYDPSRIAAQIVTGIGFLGAGMIFIKKQSINGLTTAAGIWTTAGIGMAIGTNLYLAGAVATLLVFIVQVFLHRSFKWLRAYTAKILNIKVDDRGDAFSYIKNALFSRNIEIIDLKAERCGNGMIELALKIKLPPGFDISELLELLP